MESSVTTAAASPGSDAADPPSAWHRLKHPATQRGPRGSVLVRHAPPAAGRSTPIQVSQVIREARTAAVLPVVLYNGAEPWTAAREMGELIALAGRWLAPYQPAQRYYVLDARRVAADDLPRRNLLRAVVGEPDHLQGRGVAYADDPGPWQDSWRRSVLSSDGLAAFGSAATPPLRSWPRRPTGHCGRAA